MHDFSFNRNCFLSLSEIQNARGILDVLAEMLNAIDTGNKEVFIRLKFSLIIKTATTRFYFVKFSILRDS